MPLIRGPRYWTHQAELYHQLASLTSAGVGLISALETVRNSPPARSFRGPLQRVLDRLAQGATFSDALLSQQGRWLSQFDLALLEAGEKSGRLDSCFRLLAGYYEERARLARQVLSDLAYPAFVLHLAVLIFPTGQLTALVMQGDLPGYVWSKAALLCPVYAAVLLFLYLGQARHGESWRSALERFTRAIPVLGIARADLALARLCAALEGLISAGVSIIEAWGLAAAASGSPALRRTVASWTPALAEGQTPAEAVRASRRFPDLFTNLYSTGEVSGKLEDALQRLYRHYQEEASRKFQALAQWAPRLIYFAVLLLIAYQVISFWSAYFSQIGQLTQ